MEHEWTHKSIGVSMHFNSCWPEEITFNDAYIDQETGLKATVISEANEKKRTSTVKVLIGSHCWNLGTYTFPKGLAKRMAGEVFEMNKLPFAQFLIKDLPERLSEYADKYYEENNSF